MMYIHVGRFYIQVLQMGKNPTDFLLNRENPEDRFATYTQTYAENDEVLVMSNFNADKFLKYKYLH